MNEERNEKTTEFMAGLALDKQEHLLAYILQLTNEIKEINRRLDKIIDKDHGAIRIIELR